MEIPLLNDIVIIFGLSIAVLFIFHLIRVPAIVGFLLTGILAGPHGLGLIKAAHQVEILAEIGVVLLLFAIGLEFSLKRMVQIKRSILLGGSLQVLLTIVAVFLIATEIGLTSDESIFMGFLIALSSTAIVLKLIQERAEIDSPHGQATLGILLFQDVIIVPMMLFTPLLAGATGDLGESLIILVAKGTGIILLVAVGARWIVPQALYQITRTRSRELFLLSVFMICLAVVWLTSSMGLSLALGAFLAGLIISQSEYSHHALGNVLPFRDVFMSFFFVSIGMLLDINFLFQHPGLILLIAICFLALKATIACFAAFLLGFPLRTVILVGLALCQVGEFSFILSSTGAQHGLLAGDTYRFFLIVSVLTMAATPFIIALAPRIAEIALRLPLPGILKSGWHPVPVQGADIVRKQDHLIIIGFGVNGMNVARAAGISGIPYTILEMDPEIVRVEQAKGEPIYYGDATHEAVFHHADIKDARIVVIAISDPAATRRITEIARRLNHKIYIIVRTRYIQEMKPLYELGADDVIPEEFETSVEIFTRVLVKYLIPRDEIEKFIAVVRADGYEMLRSLSKESVPFPGLKCHLPDVEIVTLRVFKQAPAVGKTLAQIGLRKNYGVTLLAVRRNSQMLSNPDGDVHFCAGDLLVVIGPPDKIVGVMDLFDNPERG
ncbi:MAG: Calcium-gated potassium channel MthK [Candidatus Methanogaster sp.]|nr:MAG: Calcium-gated potassium channel MthK [ANME-2 cluster archaeon]